MNLHIWGEVGSLLIILLQVSYWMCRWKNYENRSIFSEDMDKSIVSPFFDSRCIFSLRNLSIVQLFNAEYKIPKLVKIKENNYVHEERENFAEIERSVYIASLQRQKHNSTLRASVIADRWLFIMWPWTWPMTLASENELDRVKTN